MQGVSALPIQVAGGVVDTVVNPLASLGRKVVHAHVLLVGSLGTDDDTADDDTSPDKAGQVNDSENCKEHDAVQDDPDIAVQVPVDVHDVFHFAPPDAEYGYPHAPVGTLNLKGNTYTHY